MSVQDYLDQMKKLQATLLNYLEKEDLIEEYLNNFMQLFQDYKICKHKQKFESVLHLLLNISNNHHRELNFFQKIEKIILYFKTNLQAIFSNFVIFNIFKSNKRILLFLFKEKIIKLDHAIISTLENKKFISANYIEYFTPEIKLFIGNDDKYSELNKKLLKKLPENFEANNILIGKELSLILYAAFFGSIQIFKYLQINSKIFNLSEFFINAIHGNNVELIMLISENAITDKEEIIPDCIKMSVKCHHVYITNYLQNNYSTMDQKVVDDIFFNSLKYYNFAFIEDIFFDSNYFCELCKYGYAPIVNILTNSREIDVNIIKIQ